MEAPAAGNSDCRLKRLALVDLQISPAGIVTIPVAINGEATRMALDTSEPLNAVSGGTASRLRLRRQTSQVWMFYVRSVQTREFVKLERLSIGDLSWSGLDALVVSDSQFLEGKDPATGVAGSLGIAMFSGVDLELDFSGHRMMIYSQDHCPGAVVSWSRAYYKIAMKRQEHGNLYFPMELDGRRVDTTLSTRDRRSVLTTDAARKGFGFDRRSAEVRHETGVHGDPDYFRPMELTSEGFDIMNARISLGTPEDAPCELVVSKDPQQSVHYVEHSGSGSCFSVPLRLGVDVLSKMHLYLAFKEQALYFTVADDASSAVRP